MAVPSHPLRRVLSQVSADRCPAELNFHCHTQCSDGSLEPVALAQQAQALGLQHLAVTDHHSTAAFLPINQWLSSQRAQGSVVPALWTGMEISCLLKGCLVHVLALGFEYGHSALHPYNQGDAAVGEPLRADAVVRAIHTAGGLAILAHPARYRLGHAVLINAAAAIGIDGGEAWYDYDMQTVWSPSPVVCEAIDQQLKNLGLLRTCGTDTHGLDLKGR
ncbi:MAG: PHP domain-containing protein [Synechococcus sp.]